MNERDEAGQVVADIDRDYDTVCQLMNAIVAEGSGVAVNPAMVETIAAVTEATIGMAEGGASAKDIAKLLKLDKSAARRRLIGACNEDLVVNLETRRGIPGKYRTTGQKAEQIAILPKTADLAAQFFSHTPLKPVPPCHREEIPQSVLERKRWQARWQAGGRGQPGGPVASRWQTALPPISHWKSRRNCRRWQGGKVFRGECEHGHGSPGLRPG